MDSETSDDRVVFMLPWHNKTVAGTTDHPCEVTHHPAPTEKEIQYILGEIRKFFNEDFQVRRSDVLAAFCGIRPLVADPKAKNTQSLVRNHLVNISDSGLVTLAGGKWTTYRKMAEDAVDAAVISKCMHSVNKLYRIWRSSVRICDAEESHICGIRFDARWYMRKSIPGF